MNPTLSDLRAAEGRFQDGDRILIRTCSNPDRSQVRKILKSLYKFCRANVIPLIVNCLETQIVRVSSQGDVELLVGPENVTNIDQKLGTIELSCSKVRFFSGDRLVVQWLVPTLESKKKRFLYGLKQWIPDDVEVVVGGRWNGHNHENN